MRKISVKKLHPDQNFLHPLRFLMPVTIIVDIIHKQTKDEYVLLIKVSLSNIFKNHLTPNDLPRMVIILTTIIHSRAEPRKHSPSQLQDRCPNQRPMLTTDITAMVSIISYHAHYGYYAHYRYYGYGEHNIISCSLWI